MYCKMCGNLLDETDLNCKICNPEVAEIPPTLEKEISWNIYEFPKPKKTEAIDFEWGEGEEKETSEQTNSGMLTFLEREEEIDNSATETITSGRDEFFTFSKKNEEFQRLLDHEYEKIKKNVESFHTRPEPTIPIPEPIMPSMIMPVNICPQIPAESSQGVGQKLSEGLLQEVDSKIIRESIPEVIQEPIPKVTQEPIPKVTQEPIPKVTQEPIPKVTQEPYINHKQDSIDRGYLNEMVEARAGFFGPDNDTMEDNDTLARKYDTVEIRVNSSKPVKVEVAMRKDSNPHIFINEPKANVVIPMEEVVEVKTQAPQIAQILQSEQGQKPEEQRAQEKRAQEQRMQEQRMQEQQEQENKPEPRELPPIILPFDNMEEEPKKKGGFMKLVVVAVSILLIVEISFWGITYFAPNSQAAKMIREKGNSAIETTAGWAGDIKGWVAGITGNEDEDKVVETSVVKDDIQKVTKPEKPAEPSPIPVADKSILIENQKSQNKNIVTVKTNDELKFIPGKDYGIYDINTSLPITNNIWSTPKDGAPIYFDNEIVGALMAFDSQWVDYVNGGSDAVLNMAKKGSIAERNAKTFSKVGKIDETFNLLEVGEIRKGQTYYYAWCHEELLIVEGGKTKTTSYNWIYSLEPVGDKIQIVNYYKF